MRNASRIIIYCILIIIMTPIIAHLYCKNLQNHNKSKELVIKVLDSDSKNIFTMDFEEYVWRATAKEVPASFEDDAIKAQAVAVRTYAYRKLDKTIPEHNGADVCTDFKHCTAFLLPGNETATYKDNTNQICKRFMKLSESTKDLILTYNNEPILAVFHAISSGVTEKSSDVWSSQLPYLINVKSELDKEVKNYLSVVSFSKNELKEIFKSTTNDNISILSRTDGGSVKEVNIFGKIYSGDEVRNMLNLRSANFSLKKDDDKYHFHVLGYGHGVGMSQNGANEYAKTGMDYKTILFKYYPGTVLENIDKLKPACQK